MDSLVLTQINDINKMIRHNIRTFTSHFNFLLSAFVFLFNHLANAFNGNANAILHRVFLMCVFPHSE